MIIEWVGGWGWWWIMVVGSLSGVGVEGFGRGGVG